MLKPLSDHVVIEPLREEKKKGSIILPDTIDKEKQERGKVLAVGPEVKELKKGDLVVFTRKNHEGFQFSEVKINDKEYFICSKKNILGILN